MLQCELKNRRKIFDTTFLSEKTMKSCFLKHSRISEECEINWSSGSTWALNTEYLDAQKIE